MAVDKMRRFKVRGDNEKGYLEQLQQYSKGKQRQRRTKHRSKFNTVRITDRINNDFRQES